MAFSDGISQASDRTVASAHVRGDVAWGVLLIIIGAVAVMMPAIAALATALALGWLLIVGGVFELAYAVQTRGRGGFGWKLTSGILTFVLGIAIVAFPVGGALSLGLLVGACLFVGGIARTALAFHLKPLRGWGWVLFDGLLSIVLGLVIGIGWPANSLLVIGVLTGVWLISTGVWRIALRGHWRAYT